MVRGWSDLPHELFEEILRRLTVVDYLKCQRVCRSWRCAVDDAVATKCPPAPQFPFLMLLHGISIWRDRHLTGFDVLPSYMQPSIISDITQEQDTSYTIPDQTWKDFPDLVRVFSVQGWLVFQNIYTVKNQKHDSILFSNPISGHEFQLPHLQLFPDLPWSKGQDCFLSVKLVFSSAPLDSSDFFVVACATVFKRKQLHQKLQQLAFWKVTDTKWTLIPIDPNFTYDHFIILDWKLYAIGDIPRDLLTVFNLKDSKNISFQNLGRPFSRCLEPIDGIYYHECGLAKDGDEILLVAHDRSYRGFRIFKLLHGYIWSEVDDLNDRVLLMDSAGIQVISAKEIKLPNNLSGGNCVFFIKDDIPLKKRYLGVFTLKDKRMAIFPLGHSIRYGIRHLWFMPSPW